ncbi:MAG: hypothetical protein CMJ59_04610 [Planctomycetaceae bacterium]|nr:hypothetical protein [Planctomycetaceae bacterium]
MTITELGPLSELIASIGVIATMVYLGVQIRQNTATLRMNAEDQRSQWWWSFNKEAASDKELLEILHQGLHDITALSDSERRRFTWYIAAMFYRVTGMYSQFLAAHLSRDSWLPHERLVQGLLQHKSVNHWRQSGFFLGSDNFKAYINSIHSNRTDWEYVDIARFYDDLTSRH